MSWEVVLLDEVEAWLLDDLDDVTYDLVAAAIDKLEHDGPTLGRPLVDKIKGSRLHNLKELRPGSAGTTEVRILFIFDPRRNAVLLVAGDKSGRWNDWYREAVPLAEKRYAQWMEEPDG
ncbi:type II toxin-antitoxin system RelE/ParE family toxin [Pseudonocardia sp. WMMC193]|uniref:type II toxin-antitoxin system RelE/ParE family toxin n=1 Tax=Pseudonocardia sp. WMMC193 TaxID=2911965 RepID=UPI001F411177|nr:type II toxin-antitoxin system RelE/ParE family toxin [Pseudonocardia sp. WMMC193]MCF7552723.1 type II toxin-antitoxin system RelE/ParE family toxin [Pseudonocardia sp. WMMC193]